MNLTVRRAVSNDITGIISLLLQIAALHHEARPDVFKHGSKKYNEHDLAIIFQDETRPVFVAVDESDNVLGYCFCQVIGNSHPVMHDHTKLYIDDFCVDENCRKQGVGKKLFAAALEYAKQLNVHAIDLNVWEFNEDAIKFYESFGFTTRSRKMELVL